MRGKSKKTMKNEKKINVAVQVLPEGKKKEAYEKVDLCISLIAASGLKYTVCPFETVIEGYWDEIMRLIAEMKDACLNAGSENIIINLKIQVSRNNDVTVDDKMAKYKI